MSVKGHTYVTVSYAIDTYSRSTLSWATVLSQTPDTALTAPSDETGNLIGYLEWADSIIEETGALFYMMRVSTIYQVGINMSTKDCSTATSKKFYTPQP